MHMLRRRGHRPHHRRRLLPAVVSLLTVSVVALGSWTAPAQALAEPEPELQPLTQRTATIDGVERDFWVYVPEDFAEFRVFDPKDVPLVVVLHPDGTDGKSYAEQTAWARVAEERNFIAVFPSATAGTWNSSRDESGPDDIAFVDTARQLARDEWKSNEVFTYIAGEGAGAGIANVLAATRAAKYVAVASLGGAAPSSVWSDAGGELNKTNTAAWQVVVGDDPDADERAQIVHWKQRNGVAGRTTSEPGVGLGATQVSRNPANPLAQVRVSKVAEAADLRGRGVVEAVYDSLFRKVVRFEDRLSNNGTLTEFKSVADMRLQEFRADLAGYQRRWYVYRPSNYASLTAGGKQLPVVLVFHGRNGSARYVAQQTRWADVAEARGFIAVFVAADPAPGTSPTANFGFNGSISPTNGDVAMTMGILDDVKARNAVDDRRVFVAGVSQGAAFTNRLAVEFPHKFAAIAPCYSGHLGASSYQDTTVVRRDVPLPVWQCRGEFELTSDFPGSEEAGRTFWRETVNKHQGPPRTQVDGRFTTEIFTDGLADYRWTVVGDIGHFMADGLAFKIWDEMFAHYERNPDGALVRKEPTKTSISIDRTQLQVRRQSTTVKIKVQALNGDDDPRATPQGAVQIFAGDKQIGTASLDAGGRGTAEVSFTSTGVVDVTARYAGDASTRMSTSDPVRVSVVKFTPSVTVSKVSPRKITVNRTRTKLTVRIGAANANLAGDVVVRHGTRVLARGKVGPRGVATLRLKKFPTRGTKNLVIQFRGNGDLSFAQVRHRVKVVR
jgi:poly(3-hydroxybutyrate) depolymerase